MISAIKKNQNKRRRYKRVKEKIIDTMTTEGLRVTFEKSPKGSERAGPANFWRRMSGRGN